MELWREDMTWLNGACLPNFEMLLQQRIPEDWDANHVILTTTTIVRDLVTKLALEIKLIKLRVIDCHMCLFTSEPHSFDFIAKCPFFYPFVHMYVCPFVFLWNFLPIRFSGNMHVTKIYIYIWIYSNLITSFQVWLCRQKNDFAIWIHISYIYIYHCSIVTIQHVATSLQHDTCFLNEICGVRWAIVECPLLGKNQSMIVNWSHVTPS